jgi:hypothetical protein
MYSMSEYRESEQIARTGLLRSTGGIVSIYLTLVLLSSPLTPGRDHSTPDEGIYVVSIERIFYCDGPDCKRHVRTAASRPASGLLTITGERKALHFCGWDCVLRHAGTKEPERVISGPLSPDD